MLKQTLIFLAGLSVGAASMYCALRKKIEIEIDESMEALENYYKDKYESSANKMTVLEDSEDEQEPNEEIKEDIYNRDTIIERLNYGAMFKGNKEETKEEVKEEKIVKNSPKIISDDEFYNDSEHDKVTVTYYSESKDFVSGKGTPIPYEDMIDNIGSEEFLEEFGQYETDTLFVRNPEQMVDYEIILEEKEYDGE